MTSNPKLSKKTQMEIYYSIMPALAYFLQNPDKENKEVEGTAYSIAGVALPPHDQPLGEKDINTFIDALNKYVSDLKQTLNIEPVEDLELQMKQSSDNLYTSVPIIDTKLQELDNVIQAKDAKKVQEILQNFLKTMKPQHQIILLNRAQSRVPYMLMDPRKKAFPGLKYGYADLMRFLCQPVRSGEVNRFTENEYLLGKNKRNPFYNPIWYPIPDNEANAKVEELMGLSRRFYAQKLAQYQVLRYKLSERNLSFEERLDLLDNMLKVVYDIQEHQMNPLELSKLPLPQKEEYQHYANYQGIRPMAKYRKEHFMNLIKMLNTYNREAPSRPAPMETGVEFVSKELDVLHRRRKYMAAADHRSRSRSYGSKRSYGSRHSRGSKRSYGSRHSRSGSRGSKRSRGSRRSRSRSGH